MNDVIGGFKKTRAKTPKTIPIRIAIRKREPGEMSDESSGFAREGVAGVWESAWKPVRERDFLYHFKYLLP